MSRTIRITSQIVKQISLECYVYTLIAITYRHMVYFERLICRRTVVATLDPRHDDVMLVAVTNSSTRAYVESGNALIKSSTDLTISTKIL